jgi:hypothetical protein
MANPYGRQRPGTITLATTIMIVRAIIGLLAVLLIFLVRDDIKQAIRDNDSSLSASDINTATNVAIGVGIAFAALVFILYIWLAAKIRRGRNWARITTIVLAVLSILGAIGTAVRPTASAARGGGVVGAILDLIILIALVSPSASAWCHQDRTVAQYR